MLWFDVEIEWITTARVGGRIPTQLWFDVEIEWITTFDNRRNPIV